MILFHGTDEHSALEFLRDPRLDPAKPLTKKIDGPPGFFLSFAATDAEFFALRRGRGVVLQYDVSTNALAVLNAAGAVERPIPVGARSPRFSDNELFVPIDAFEVFNNLLASGAIRVSAQP